MVYLSALQKQKETPTFQLTSRQSKKYGEGSSNLQFSSTPTPPFL